MSAKRLKHIIVISDLHVGSHLGLCPPRITLDEGGHYRPGRFQRILWKCWREFWDSWVPEITGGERFAVVVNGDVIDGTPHGSVAGLANLTDQENAAVEILAPIKERAAKFFMVRGTEAHVGKSAQSEERIAEALRAEGNAEVRARWDLRIKLGKDLLHFAHHTGTTTSPAYELTALTRELTAAWLEAAQWGHRPPDLLIRSHRHRFAVATLPVAESLARVVVTPGWQLRTPFVWRTASLRRVQIGGVCLSARRDGNPCDIYQRIWNPPDQPPVEV